MRSGHLLISLPPHFLICSFPPGAASRSLSAALPVAPRPLFRPKPPAILTREWSTGPGKLSRRCGPTCTAEVRKNAPDESAWEASQHVFRSLRYLRKEFRRNEIKQA